MVRSASARASGRSPAWSARAPQQAASPPGSATPAPVASITRWTSAWTSRIQASMTQPVNSQTSRPDARRRAVRRTGTRSGRPSRRDRRRGSSRTRWASPRSDEPASRSRWWARARSPRPTSASCRGIGCRGHRSRGRFALVSSIRWPNGTPDGQAVSQPRHWTQVAIERRNAPSISAPSHCTWRMAAIRPRGDSASSPVTRYVGQCGRHSPQATQHASSSSATPRSTRKGAAPSVTPANSFRRSDVTDSGALGRRLAVMPPPPQP